MKSVTVEKIVEHGFYPFYSGQGEITTLPSWADVQRVLEFLSLLFRSGGDYGSTGVLSRTSKSVSIPFIQVRGRLPAPRRPQTWELRAGFYPFYSGQGEITRGW